MIFYCRLDFVIKKTDGAQFFLLCRGLLEAISWELGVGRGGVGSCDQVVWYRSNMSQDVIFQDPILKATGIF